MIVFIYKWLKNAVFCSDLGGRVYPGECPRDDHTAAVSYLRRESATDAPSRPLSIEDHQTKSACTLVACVQLFAGLYYTKREKLEQSWLVFYSICDGLLMITATRLFCCSGCQRCCRL